MARLNWGAAGERFYELGVDQGVLYVGDAPGVAWTGLTSVSESPTGGEARAYYIDGVKYLNLSSAEEFEATINAFSSPPEFGPCDGNVSIQNGLFVTQQPRKKFGFSYRTTIGNDVDGTDHAYKIHLVYDALAAPSGRDNNTVGDSTDPASFSWAITTLPPALTGFKPTAHFVIDSRKTLGGLMRTIEDILYGSDSAAPRFPTPSELLDLFMSNGPVLWRNLVTNPRFEDAPTVTAIRTNLFTDPTVNQAGSPRWGGSGGSSQAQSTEQAFSGANSYKIVATGGLVFGGYGSTLSGSVTAGDPIYGSVHVYSSVATTVRVGIEFKDSSLAKISQVQDSPVSILANTWTRVGGYGGIAPANTSYVTATCYTTTNAVAGHLMYLDAMLIEKSATLRSYFQGDFAPGTYTYRWTGTAFASTSEMLAPLATGQTGTASNNWSLVWWVETTGAEKYGRWRSKAGTPAASWRVARSTALSRSGIVAGQKYTLMGRMRQSGWTASSIPLRLSNSNGTNEIMPAVNIANVGSDWVDFRIVFTALIDASVDTGIGFYASLPGTPPATEDGYFDLAYWSIISGDYQGSYFDGSTPNYENNYFSWEGTTNSSTSILRSWDF